jgi:hypothetical protein
LKKFLFVLMALLALARSSMADPRPRVVVLRTPELVHALVVQLEPWDVEIAEADDMPPHTTDQAAVIAEAHAAAALVWASGTELHVYDARTHEMFSRPLGQTLPLDPPAASSVALTVKTMLRSTNVAPAAKQIEQPAPTTTAKPSPLPMAPAPNAPPVKKQTGPPPVAFIEVGLGGKVIATDGELRLSAGFGLHPPKSPFSGALEAHIGTGASFKDGRWVRGLFDILARYSLSAWSQTALEAGVGPSLSVLSLDGTIAGFPVHVIHVDPGLRMTIAFELRSRTLAIAAVAAGDFQAHVLYRAAAMQVLEVSPAGVSFILRARVGNF